MRRVLGLLVLVMVFVGACGGSDDPVSESTSDVSEVIASGDEEEAAEAIEDLAETLEEVQEAEGGGGASLTIGSETYTFDSVLCAIGEEETGQEGAEFVLSAIKDGTQLYFSIDSFGHTVSLDDIEDFENPSVSWSSLDDNFIELDGKSASGEAGFVDGTTDSFDAQQGSFEGTCP